jgi:hypothetical protein
VIFLLATAQVSAPIDGDLQSVSEPIAGVVLMLVAGFAPYMTYKAISFMGFDMYHAMSAEQEAKSALNRPMPIPMVRRPGAEPSKILNAGSHSGNSSAPSGGSSPTPPPAATGSGAAPAGGSTTGGASPAGGASGGGAGSAAGGAVAAGGVLVAKEAAVAGVATGSAVGSATTQHSDAANQAPPSVGAPVPPHAVDAVPASANGQKG